MDSSQRQIALSEPLRPVALIVLPLNLSPTNGAARHKAGDKKGIQGIHHLTSERKRHINIFHIDFLSVATPAEPHGEKNFFFVQILGGEKLLKFVE